jgi:hypothetical protein
VRINNDHMYHGAVLTQIAEHSQFTTINAFRVEGVVSRSAFKVNDDIGVYLKYASKPSTGYDEYVFTFHGTHLAELENLSRRAPSVYLALVCIQDREICGLHYGDFMAMITARREAQGSTESQYTVLVTATKGKSFRVYMNAPGVRKTMLSLPLVVSRRAFPDMIFRDDARQMARTDA